MVDAGRQRFFLLLFIVDFILLDLLKRSFPGPEIDEEQHDHKGDGEDGPGIEERV
ncbi:hypothetical protein D3C75_1118320 [compost metagenome]